MSDFRQRKALVRIREAHAALGRGDYASAASGFEHGLRLDPELPDAPLAWLAWLETLEAQGELLEAASVGARALGRHPDDPGISLALVHAQIETGQFAAARSGAAALVQRWPEQRAPLAYLARVLRDTRSFWALDALLDAALSGAFRGDLELEALARRCELCRGAGSARALKTEEQLSPGAKDGAKDGDGTGAGPSSSEPAALPPESMRERLRRRGVVLLGTGHDDGLEIPWYSTYLCSHYDVVATCARLVGFARRFDWRWARIVALDPAAEVLAQLLAWALDRPLAPWSAGLDPADSLAVGSLLSPGWETGERGPWALRCAAAGGLFAFGALDWSRHSAPLPPLLGVAAGERVCLPWWRLGEARIGFSGPGLIAELAPEIDPRPAAEIAAAYRRGLETFELGHNFQVAARDLHEHRSALSPGLRARGDFAQILASVAPRPGPAGTVAAALQAGETAELLRALSALEATGARDLGEAELGLLEARFVDTPQVRSRLSDLLYRAAPERFTAVLEGLVSRPVDELPQGERDGLLHLFGCNPWGARPGDQLSRWLRIGSMSTRSEIIQSKYGLHHLEGEGEGEGESESAGEGFAAVLDACFADEVPVVLGTLRWLHDNPQLHEHVAVRVPALLDHGHPDVVFEALQCTRVAGLVLPLARLDGFARHPHARLRSAALEHLELHPPTLAMDRARAVLDRASRGRSAGTGEGVDAIGDRAARDSRRAPSVVAVNPWAEQGDGGDSPGLAWAAARVSIRSGDRSARVDGAAVVATYLRQSIAARGGPTPGALTRELLRALATADSFEILAVILDHSPEPSVMKVVAAALGPALLGFDDPRLLPYLRASRAAFGIDPPPGYASFFLRHGDPAEDRAAVEGAQGATDLRAGYEAKAVLARWGQAQAKAELERALDYAPVWAAAALEAWLGIATRVVGLGEHAALDATLTIAVGEGDRAHARPVQLERGALLWRVLSRRVDEAARGDQTWIESFKVRCSRSSEAGERGRWSRFMEDRLRASMPSKFVVGAVSAEHRVFAALSREGFESMVARSLAGTPDRFCVDIFEWLSASADPLAPAWALRLIESPHWALRAAARRHLDRC